MKIITAATGDMKDMVNRSMYKNTRQGYAPILYDLGGLGYGKYYDPAQDVEMARGSGVISSPNFIANSIWKPKIILDALENTNEKHLVWMDADAFCIRPIHQTFQLNFDIAVTIRPPSENEHSSWPMFDGYINAGVIFFRNNESTKELVRQWIDAIPHTQTRTDQEALNVVMEAPRMRKHYRVYRTMSLIPKMSLPTEIYNYYYFPLEPKDRTKVLHFKGHKEESMKYFNYYFNITAGQWVGG
jgi:hypothetical protein